MTSFAHDVNYPRFTDEERLGLASMGGETRPRPLGSIVVERVTPTRASSGV